MDALSLLPHYDSHTPETRLSLSGKTRYAFLTWLRDDSKSLVYLYTGHARVKYSLEEGNSYYSEVHISFDTEGIKETRVEVEEKLCEVNMLWGPQHFIAGARIKMGEEIKVIERVFNWREVF